ncbi:hypothetical protein E1264_22635 [Actinomadura sp. KC216]|uniref:hypothetical protein n=1 Tax=Actinomadura sp. KC216 TaxID=2530370 RepID=UPI0010528579|nr:hypothetical protein [Actinomadura sp. KC216]TDB85004.1 hypothetical protein E1264_22635 [Actinomadura sp. KC216]
MTRCYSRSLIPSSLTGCAGAACDIYERLIVDTGLAAVRELTRRRVPDRLTHGRAPSMPWHWQRPAHRSDRVRPRAWLLALVDSSTARLYLRHSWQQFCLLVWTVHPPHLDTNGVTIRPCRTVLAQVNVEADILY